MSERHVVVLGSGAAGASAALAAKEAGARVTVVRGRPGASSLTSGALDGSVSRRPASGGSVDGEVGEDARRVAAMLGIHAIGACRVATSAGTIRAAAGRDLALADLGASSGPVLVATVSHPSWDAAALATAYGELDSRGFVTRDVGLLMQPSERVMQHAELAALHDDDTRLARAAERIRAALDEGGTFGAVLLPPWLGASRPRARELSERVGLPCGEVLVAIDGPAGARFERARDRALQNANIEMLSGTARSVTSSDDGCEILVGDATLHADAVVLATGGLLGGLEYTPGDAAPARGAVRSRRPAGGGSVDPPPGRAPFALSFESPVILGRNGRPLVVPGSVFGVPPESLTWPNADPPALETVGILVDGRFRAAPHVFACGDALEGSPRTMLAAISTGAAAGRSAAEA